MRIVKAVVWVVFILCVIVNSDSASSSDDCNCDERYRLDVTNKYGSSSDSSDCDCTTLKPTQHPTLDPKIKHIETISPTYKPSLEPTMEPTINPTVSPVNNKLDYSCPFGGSNVYCTNDECGINEECVNGVCCMARDIICLNQGTNKICDDMNGCDMGNEECIYGLCCVTKNTNIETDAQNTNGKNQNSYSGISGYSQNNISSFVIIILTLNILLCCVISGFGFYLYKTKCIHNKNESTMDDDMVMIEGEQSIDIMDVSIARPTTI